MWNKRAWGSALGVVTLVAITGACGAGSSGTTPGGQTASSSAAPSLAPTSAARTSAGLITVPDVSGMNHQQAQDTMQAAGLYNLREVDGKGLGRMLVVDRNWVQVGQDPPAGTRVTADTVVTLTAIKDTDR